MNPKGPSDRNEFQTLSERFSAWRELLDRCGRKPARKRVHALRVVTLRIQAEVEDQLSGLVCASHEAQAMVRFGKLAGKLRDALGSVRELDVWIGKLQRLRESLCGSTEYVPRSTRETARQIERLEGRLAKKRERAGMKLTTEIERRSDDLLSRAQDVEKAASEWAAEADGERASKLLIEFAGIVAEFPALDESNLHDFRKRIKKIRYLAEIHSADPACGRIGVQVKKAQDVIGEWYDWQVLARTSRHGKDAKVGAAAELLSSLTAEAYEAAISTCQGVLRRMADLENTYVASSEKLSKRSVSSEEIATRSDLKLA